MKKISEKFYEKRESICVSHYPCLTHVVDTKEYSQGLNLTNHNTNNYKNASIYIHIPFCDKICKFCPFNKFVKTESKVEEYLSNVYHEIDIYSETIYVQDTHFQCIALGGGTPTCLSKEQLCDLVNYCKSKFKMNDEIEISIEGNPENSDFEKLLALADCGVNRISFGIQTFDENLSEELSLQHSVQEGINAIKNAHDVGIHNVGIDLMYNIPGQTNEQFKNDILTAYELGVEHITLFAMNIPPKTKISREISEGKIQNIGNLEREIDLYSLAEKLLLSLGYIQYSVYDFALPNKVNLHAYNYFLEQRDLVGIGAAAFGYINGYMYINKGNLQEYGSAVQNKMPAILYGEKASIEDKMYGMFAKGFRMLSISKALFERIFNIPLEESLPEKFEALLEEGLIYFDEYSVSLTKKGRIFGNNVCEYFIQDKYKNNKIIRHMLTKGVEPETF